MDREILMAEFALFTRFYLRGKAELADDRLLDAYTNILQAMQHWAKIAVIEGEQHPETAIWDQVRHINAGVYKLYEELAHSDETLEQRVRLILLACEFCIISKIEKCAEVLLHVLGSRKESWGLEELEHHPKLRGIADDLTLLLEKLVRKSLVIKEASHSGHTYRLYEANYIR